MELLNYLQNKDCLSDPMGSLSTVVPAKVISSVNDAVCCEIEASFSKNHRRPYKRYKRYPSVQ